MPKRYCIKCSARIKSSAGIKGRTRQMLCENCLILEYNKQKNGKEKEKSSQEESSQEKEKIT